MTCREMAIRQFLSEPAYGVPKNLESPGKLGHVHFAIDYLVDPDVYDLGEHLAVIGAGNSAMDVARTALRKGTKK